MKSAFITAIVVITIIAQAGGAFAQWTQTSSGTTNMLYGIHFPGKNYGYACGLSGVICKTTNGGINWTNSIPSATSYLYSIYFTSDSIGYAAGYNGRIMKTTDYGSSWVNIVSGTTQVINSVYFPSANTGYAAANGNKILKTTDAGLNWITPVMDVSGTEDYYSVYFINNNTGWVCGEESGGRIRKTTDGGDIWISQGGASGTTRLNGIRFRNANVGIAVGTGGAIYRTSNGGDNWAAVSSGVTSELFEVDFSASGTLNSWYIAGAGGRILRSTDNGVTWGLLTSGIGTSMYTVSVINRDTVFMTGANGIILRSYNGSVLTSVTGNENNTPEKFMLAQNFPNPFNPTTDVEFRVANFGFVTLKVYNSQGKEIRALINENLNAGSYSIKFDGSGLQSGVYFYKLEAGEFSETRKMVLVK